MGEIPSFFLFKYPFPPVGYHRDTEFFYNLRLREHRAGFIGFPETQSFIRTRLRNKQYMCYDKIVNGCTFLISPVSNKTLCLRKTKNESSVPSVFSIIKKICASVIPDRRKWQTA